MRPGRDRGQSTVEFALIVPLVFVTLLIVVQVAVTAHAQLATIHLAREAARALAVDPTMDLDGFVDEVSTLKTDDLVVEAHFELGSNDEERLVTVVVEHQSSAVLPLFAPFSNYFAVRSQATMLLE